MTSPVLSTLFLLPYGFRDIEDTLECLLRQNCASSIEVVCVLPPEFHHQEPPERFLGQFHSFQKVLVDRLNDTGEGYAAAVQAASAEVVVVSEEHSFPRPNWADALLRRHAEGWAAVGAVVENGNPQSAVSWASFLINFGMAAENAPAGPSRYLASHQSSYKRQILLKYEDRLADLLGMEARLQEQLQADGERCFLESQARALHYNVEPWSTFWHEQSLAPRQYAALRAAHWPNWKRLLYAAAGPLIWALRMKRTWRYAAQCPIPAGRRSSVAVAMAVGLAAATISEVRGYLWGSAGVGARRFPLEFRRREQVRSCEVVCGSA
jgi:hypothetical protein